MYLFINHIIFLVGKMIIALDESYILYLPIIRPILFRDNKNTLFVVFLDQWIYIYIFG